MQHMHGVTLSTEVSRDTVSRLNFGTLLFLVAQLFTLGVNPELLRNILFYLSNILHPLHGTAFDVAGICLVGQRP